MADGHFTPVELKVTFQDSWEPLKRTVCYATVLGPLLLQQEHWQPNEKTYLI